MRRRCITAAVVVVVAVFLMMGTGCVGRYVFERMGLERDLVLLVL
jgi:hypothetical protein